MAIHIPRRFNEEAVSRYESVIRSLCASWPNPIMVDPAPLAVETFRQRFRDAVRGVKDYKQGDPELFELLSKLDEPMVVSEFNGQLRIAPKSVSKSRPENALQAGVLISGVATLADETAELVGEERAIVEALALLTARGFISSSRITGVTEEFVWSCFPEGYEGGVVTNADGTLTVY